MTFAKDANDVGRRTEPLMFRAILSRRGAAVAVIIGCVFGAVYAALNLYRRSDGNLLPGNELVLPPVPAFVPGTNVGVGVSLPRSDRQRRRRGHQLRA